VGILYPFGRPPAALTAAVNERCELAAQIGTSLAHFIENASEPTVVIFQAINHLGQIQCYLGPAAQTKPQIADALRSVALPPKPQRIGHGVDSDLSAQNHSLPESQVHLVDQQRHYRQDAAVPTHHQ